MVKALAQRRVGEPRYFARTNARSARVGGEARPRRICAARAKDKPMANPVLNFLPSVISPGDAPLSLIPS